MTIASLKKVKKPKDIRPFSDPKIDPKNPGTHKKMNN